MIVRKMRKSDLRNVAELHNQLNLYENQWMNFSPKFLKLETSVRWIDKTYKNKLKDILVAEDKGKIVSFLLYIYRPKGKVFAENYFYIEDLFVTPEYRGRGIGKKLMNLVEEEAKKRGIKKLRLSSKVKNTPANTLYKGLGYKVEQYDWNKMLD